MLRWSPSYRRHAARPFEICRMRGDSRPAVGRPRSSARRPTRRGWRRQCCAGSRPRAAAASRPWLRPARTGSLCRSLSRRPGSPGRCDSRVAPAGVMALDRRGSGPPTGAAPTEASSTLPVLGHPGRACCRAPPTSPAGHRRCARTAALSQLAPQYGRLGLTGALQRRQVPQGDLPGRHGRVGFPLPRPADEGSNGRLKELAFGLGVLPVCLLALPLPGGGLDSH